MLESTIDSKRDIVTCLSIVHRVSGKYLSHRSASNLKGCEDYNDDKHDGLLKNANVDTVYSVIPV